MITPKFTFTIETQRLIDEVNKLTIAQADLEAQTLRFDQDPCRDREKALYERFMAGDLSVAAELQVAFREVEVCDERRRIHRASVITADRARRLTLNRAARAVIQESGINIGYDTITIHFIDP
jgi:hypothetical protein